MTEIPVLCACSNLADKRAWGQLSEEMDCKLFGGVQGYVTRCLT